MMVTLGRWTMGTHKEDVVVVWAPGWFAREMPTPIELTSVCTAWLTSLSLQGPKTSKMKTVKNT